MNNCGSKIPFLLLILMLISKSNTCIRAKISSTCKYVYGIPTPFLKVDTDQEITPDLKTCIEIDWTKFPSCCAILLPKQHSYDNR